MAEAVGAQKTSEETIPTVLDLTGMDLDEDKNLALALQLCQDEECDVNQDDLWKLSRDLAAQTAKMPAGFKMRQNSKPAPFKIGLKRSLDNPEPAFPSSKRPAIFKDWSSRKERRRSLMRQRSFRKSRSGPSAPQAFAEQIPVIKVAPEATVTTPSLKQVPGEAPKVESPISPLVFDDVSLAKADLPNMEGERTQDLSTEAGKELSEDASLLLSVSDIKTDQIKVTEVPPMPNPEETIQPVSEGQDAQPGDCASASSAEETPVVLPPIEPENKTGLEQDDIQTTALVIVDDDVKDTTEVTGSPMLRLFTVILAVLFFATIGLYVLETLRIRALRSQDWHLY